MMLKNLVFDRAILIVCTIFVLATTPAVLARITAYNNYDTATSPWYYTIEPLYEYNEQLGSGGSFVHNPTGNGYGYPAGNSAFGGCVETNPPMVVYHVNYGETTVITGDEGTIEVWFAPPWNGENQGGNHPNGTYGGDIFIFGPSEWSGPFNVFFFDNGVGSSPGYQIFLYWADGVQTFTIENWSQGNTMDWTLGSWHHICVSWDTSTIMLGLDGNVVGEVARTDPGALPDQVAGYFFGRNTAGGPTNCADGWFDDLTISNHPKYTTAAGGYIMPTNPQMADPIYLAYAPEPNDLAINISKYTDLKWQGGLDVVTHKVYLDSVENNVENRLGTPVIVNEPDSNCMPPISLALGQTYYWVVDEVDSSAVTRQGNLWQFTVETGNAVKPSPYNDQMDVYRDTNLSWQLAPSTVTNMIYFDSNENLVQNRSVTPVIVSAPDCNCPVSYEYLESNTVYYWAVDSVDDIATTHSGDIWKFTTERKAKPPLMGDLGKDCKVDFKDIAIYINQYLEDISPWDLLCAELNNKKVVDNRDYAMLANNFAESDIPLGFKVLGTIVPPEYDPPTIPGGFIEQDPDTYTGYYRPTAEETARGYLVYVKNYLDYIYPVTTPQHTEITNQLTAFSAPGEYEPVTFTIFSISDLNDVSITVSDLTGPADSSIESRNIDVRSVRCWPRRVWENPPVNKYIISPWFLEKRDPLDIDSGMSKRFWITLWIPADTVAGTYNGTVTINALKGGVPSNYVLDIELDVLGIELMTPPTLHGMYYHMVDMATPEPHPAYSDEYLYKEVMNMREHGMNNIFVMVFPDITSSIQGPNVVFDLDPVDSFIEDYHDAGFRDVIWNTNINSFLPTWSGGIGAGSYSANVKGFHDQLVANGWSRPVASTMDETDATGNHDITNQFLSQLKSAVPEMKTYTTIVYPENSELFEPYLDIRAFSSYADGTLSEPTKAAQKELWMYSGPGEKGSKANRFYRGFWANAIELDGVQAWVYFLLYEYDKLFNDLGGGASGGPNHRGWVLPAPDGPLPCPEWECAREGIEDGKYIYTLETLIKQANDSGDPTLITLAANAQSYLDSVFAGIDTSPAADLSVFPCTREANLKSLDFHDDARVAMAAHIQAISDALAALP